MKKVFSYLRYNNVQRWVYCFFLLFWTAVNIDQNIYQLNYQSSFGVIYLWLFLFPASMLILQMLFNSYLGWLLSFLFYCSFILYLFITVSVDLYTKSQNDFISYTDIDILLIGLAATILIIIGYIIYRIKPKN